MEFKLVSILFTHSDMDGRGCEIVYRLAQRARGIDEDLYRVVVCENSTINSQVMDFITENKNHIDSNTEIIFSDICPSSQVIGRLLYFVDDRSLGCIKIYDHHKTNEYLIDMIPNAVIISQNDLGVPECGTSLIYRAVVNDIENSGINYDMNFISRLVDTIRSYDTYEWKQTNNIIARKLNILFSMIGGDNFVKRYYDRIINHTDMNDLILPNDMLFVDCKYDFEQRTINSVTLDDVHVINVRGYKTALLIKTIPANTSELANQFLEKYPDIDMFIEFSLYGEGTYSIRTNRKDLNTGRDIAAPIGGGGHPAASGASLPDFIKDAIRNIIVYHLNGDDINIRIDRYKFFKE